MAVKDAPDQKDKEKAGEAPSAGGKGKLRVSKAWLASKSRLARSFITGLLPDISVDGEGSGGGGAEEDGGEGEKRKKTDASQTTER